MNKVLLYVVVGGGTLQSIISVSSLVKIFVNRKVCFISLPSLPTPKIDNNILLRTKLNKKDDFNFSIVNYM